MNQENEKNQNWLGWENLTGLKQWFSRHMTLTFILGLIILGSLTEAMQSSPLASVQQTKLALPQFSLINIDEKNQYSNYSKVTLNLRVYDFLDESEIKQIAYHFKNLYSGYQRIFILYYQPDMEVGEGAWAISHFDPELRLSILGIRKQDMEAKTAALEKLDEATYGEELLGTWLDDHTGFRRLIRISRGSNGEYKETTISLESLYIDNEPLQKLGEKYWYESNFGEYYIIEQSGTLGWYDEQGKFASLKMVGENQLRKTNNSRSSLELEFDRVAHKTKQI